MGNERKKKRIRWQVLLPPWIVVIAVLVLNLTNYEVFVSSMNRLIGWILKNFAWMFNSISLASLILVIVVYLSPMGRIRFGGAKAKPIIGYTSYVWIVLCTIMGAGLMLWACAEPMSHIHHPPANIAAGPMSGEAILWAMETIMLEWTFTPMAIYALPALLFAFVFYNMRKDFSIGSMLHPLLGDRVTVRWKRVIDCVCLFCLCMGMASSLGSGVLLIVEGVSRFTGGAVQVNAGSWSVCGAVIILCYILSASSGLKRGIKHLSTLNSYFYLVLGLVVFLAGPTAYILNLCVESFGAYLSDFFKLSLWTSSSEGDGWSLWWPQFYWCTWLTWMPISAVFLGKISRGYTVRETLNAIFVIPALFSVIWMALFSGTSINFELQGFGINAAMEASGTAAASYAMLEHLPAAILIIPLFLLTAFISYVTSADSNIHAMSSLCTDGLEEDDTESPVSLKIFWGATIGGLCLIMLQAFGIDGMKMLADLGGFLSAFLMILFLAAFIKVIRDPGRFDRHRDNYDHAGRPVIHSNFREENGQFRKGRSGRDKRKGHGWDDGHQSHGDRGFDGGYSESDYGCEGRENRNVPEKEPSEGRPDHHCQEY